MLMMILARCFQLEITRASDVCFSGVIVLRVTELRFSS